MSPMKRMFTRTPGVRDQGLGVRDQKNIA